MAVRRPPTTFSDEISAADLAANSVGASELADNAVDTAAIADDAVTQAKVGASAIGATELASNAVTTAKITDANITAAKVASSAITKEKIAAEAIEVKPHIKYGMLYPATKDAGGTVRLSDGVTAHSGTVYGTVQADGKSYYYTDIKGSKPIKDPRIGAYFGSQRHKFKSLQLLEQETATHGSKVSSIDGREWCRLSNGGAPQNTSDGLHITFSTGFMEVTGYLSDFNLIMQQNTVERGFKAKIDGTDLNSGNEITTWETSSASPLNGRYVDAGSVANVTNTTTLGIHTIHIAPNAPSDNMRLYGIELIAQDTGDATRRNHVNIPAQNVVSYGKRFSIGSDTLTNAVHKHYNPFAFKTDGTTAWASGANNGTSFPVGTGSSHNIDTATSLGLENWKSGTDYYKPYNGGRVVRWVANDGTIKTSVTVMPPNARSIGNSGTLSGAAAKANASIANNQYKPTFEAGTTDDFPTTALTEVAKTFRHKEFGNGSANAGAGGTYADTSMLNATVDDISYVMDDGLTSLSGQSAVSNTHPISYINQNGHAWYFTFIGTGFTLVGRNPSNAETVPTAIVQNLPYGTHVVRIGSKSGAHIQTEIKVDGVEVYAAASGLLEYAGIVDLTIHQPKKPLIPEDACILADYMLMADFVAQTANSGTEVSKGVRLLSASRDIISTMSGVHTAMQITATTVPFALQVGGSSAHVMKAAFFGTRVGGNKESNGTSTTAGHVKIDGSNVSFTAVDASTSTDVNDLVIQSTASTLGLHTGEIAVVATGKSNRMDFASPIHTSSHYQPFETPFLKELVGGDRNMEQNNLIVTPDGKSWDEVTRDTSYIGSGRVSAAAENDTWILNNDHGVFDEMRGDDSTAVGPARYNKDFAIGYDKFICLVDGNYKITFKFLQKHPEHVYLRVNGANISGSHHQANSGEYNTVALVENVQLKRGDYVQTYDQFHGGIWSHFYIERI